MNKLKKFVALALVLCMVLTLVPVRANAASEDFMRVYHLDCGRKFFEIADVEELIDLLSENGYTHLELALGNDGLRLILDDMSVLTYDGDAVAAGIRAGNVAYSHSGEWTEAEMDGIIDYAAARSIEIIPLINTPGHMDAILDAMESVGISGAYNGSARTVDVTNTEAVKFTQALVSKYVDYFASKGCTYFNMGADEYANDVYTSGSMGFGHLQTYGLYGKFADYVNGLAGIIKDADMTPIAFNDGLYFNNNSTAFDTDIVAAYWTSGWGSYSVASAATLAEKGHEILNTNDGWYYVLGRDSGTYGYNSSTLNGVQNVSVTDVSGSNDPAPIGAMACLWCDEPSVSYAASKSRVQSQITLLAENNPDYFVAASAEEEIPEVTAPAEKAPAANSEEKTITVYVGGTATDTITGGEYAADETELDKSIATVSVTTTPAKEATVSYTHVSVTCNDLISSNSTQVATGYYHKVGDDYYPVYATRARNGSTRYNYTWYYSTDDGVTFTQIGSQTRVYSTTAPSFTVYTKTGTEAVEASTTVTFRGVKAGTTYVTVGNVVYTVNVLAEDPSSAAGLEVSFWITNRKVTANGATSMTIAAKDAYGVDGVLLSKLVPTKGAVENNDTTFWKGTRHPSGSYQEDGKADMTLSSARSDFNYIRYYGGSWAISADGSTWTNVRSTDQIVAYYLQTTQITAEVTTNVVDWGEVYSDWKNNSNTGHWFWGGYVENGSKYIFMDCAVVYEDNTQNPATFPTDNTWFYHFDGHSASNPRVMGAISFTENEDYEIWKVTVTDGTSSGYSRASTFESTYDDDTETTVWDESMGGEPSVPSLTYTANRSGKLIRVYVRAKVTPDALTVHYMDRSANNIEFYSYNIAVDANKGTKFHEAFGMGTGTNTLVNNTVINIRNVEQAVSADLQTMPEIKAYYRYCTYTLVDTVRSEDGKHVYLYYTFTPVVSFVADFGLPLEITPTDLNQEGYSTDGADIQAVKVIGTYDTEAGSSAHSEYGTLTVSGQTVTYTPTRVLQGVDFFTIFVNTPKAEDAEAGISYRVYIFPATSVYYEESIADLGRGWTVSGTANAGKQELQKAGEAAEGDLNFGYTGAYTAAGATNGTQAKSVAAGSKATIEFTGTGLEIYANSTPDTGTISVLLYHGKKDDGTDKLVKLYQADTGAISGSTDATDNQNTSSYGLPIVSITGLEHGSYKAVVQHTGAGHDLQDVFFDGFRVLNTLSDSASSAYDESEHSPEFLELRNAVLTGLNVAADPDAGEESSVYEVADRILSQVYENEGSSASLALLLGDGTLNVQDLLDNGPKNELFLWPGESLTFNLGQATAQIGLKALNGTVTYRITNGTAGAEPTTGSVTTSADMFYHVGMTGTIVIENTHESNVLSITKLKLFGADSLRPLTAADVAYTLSVLGHSDEQLERPGAPVNNPFADVAEEDWYYDSVLWALKNGITTGADAAHFLPGELCQRAAVVTFLWRAAGCPEPETTVNPFVDVTEDAFFYKAVLWAVEQGITTGVDTAHFAPFGACTRAQVVTFLWRAEGCPAASAENPFADVAEGQWYTDAVLWAVENGITNGMGGSVFGVESICNRAQIVTFLYRASVK